MSYREFLNDLLIGGGSGGGGGASNWDEITGKPSAFPPSAHTHAQADVTGLPDIAAKAHEHANKATLDKFGESGGKPTYDGAEIGGSAVDESRLLPALDSVPTDRNGNPVVFKAVSEGMDERTVLYCPFDVDWNDHSANGARFFEVGFSESSSSCMSISLEQKKFGAGSLLSTDGGPKHTLQGQLATPVGGSDFTMHFWIYVNAHEGYPILSTMSRLVTSGDNVGDVLEGIYAGGLCFITYDNQLWFDLTSGNNHSEFLRITAGTNIQGGWHHIALVRQGNNWYFFLDGVLGATKVKADVQGMPCLNLGGWKTSHGKAYLDELIILDYAKWITDFEPPTQPATTLTKSYTVSDKNDKSGGTVRSVNNQLPDESGNVTVEIGGGTVDESRLLPALDSVPVDRSGNPVVFDYQSGIDTDTLCLLHLDDATWTDSTGKNTVTQNGGVAKVADAGYFNKSLDLTGNLYSGSLSWLTLPWISKYAVDTWTIEFFAKPTKSVHNFMFFGFGDNREGFCLGSQSLENLWFGNNTGAYTASCTFNLNEWYWIVAQYDGVAVKVYVNNELIVEGNYTPITEGYNFHLGNLYTVNNQDNTFIGLMDEFRWSKGLRYPAGVMTTPTQPFGMPTKNYAVSKEAPIIVPAPADDELLIGQGGKFVKLTLAELKAKLDALA